MQKKYIAMKRVNVVLVILGLMLGVSAVTTVSLADVTVTHYLSNGQTQKNVFKSPGTADIRVDCRTGSCVQCGACHTSEPESEILAKLSQRSWEKHTSVYFPRQTYSLSEGRRLLWDRDGSYYINQRNRLVRYSKDNKLVWTAPAGSRILKNKRGEPFVVLFSGEPSR